MTYDEDGDEIEKWNYTNEIEDDVSSEDSYFTIDYEKISQYLETELSHNI